MSKRVARKQKRNTQKSRPKSRRNLIAFVCSVLCLTLAAGVMAQWKILPGTSKPLALAPAPQGSFAPTSPSKEYVYAGGRLVATEEPAAAATPSSNNAMFVSQSVPATMVAGQTYNVSVTMKNTGTTTWRETSDAFYRLGSQNPVDNVTWRAHNRVYLSQTTPPVSTVAPGSEVTFAFAVTAPSTAGTYNFQSRMVQDAVEWFGDYTPNVSVTVTNSGGGADHSLSLGSTNSYLSAPSSTSLNITGPVTLEAWVKTNSSTGVQSVISRFGHFTNPDGGYALYIENGVPVFYTMKNGSDYDYVPAAAPVPTGSWHHIAGVFDGTEMRIYLDGTLSRSKSSSFAPGTGTKNLSIGVAIDGNQNPVYAFSGLIDEVRVSDSARYSQNFTAQAHLSTDSATRALWKFDGQATTDSSGNSNTGTLTNGATYSTDVPGATVNHSLSVSSLGSYLEVPNSTGPDGINLTGPMTAEAWVKLNSATGVQSVLSRFGPSPNPDGGYALYIENGRPVFYTLKNGNEYDYVMAGSTLPTGSWHHVAGVYDGTQLRIYIDGTLSGSKTATQAPVSGGTSLTIGAVKYNGNVSYQFDGQIDEVRLTVGARYTGNFPTQAHATTDANTKGLWKFDGQTGNDSSGVGNHGALVGGASYSTDTP
jgi:hypothetical protein